MKLLKRHDKHSPIPSRRHLQFILSSSPLCCGDMPKELQERLEEMYTKAFTDQNRKLGNKKIRGEYHTHHKPDKCTSFKLGVSIGVCVCLSLVLAFICVLTPDIEETIFFKAVFPLYHSCGLVLLLLWMWGLDVYAWEHVHVNHALILKVNHRSHLTSTEVWHSAAVLTLLYFLFAVPYFAFEAAPSFQALLGLHSLNP